jgi:ketosteroid isomerase-like protein
MESNKQLIEAFYSAFQRKDYAAMNACYYPEVHFWDPVFNDLQGKEAMAMWHMLCERGKDLTLEYSGVEAGETAGSAHWEAHYTFSTGRKVHNIIEAAFEFRDGKIIKHTDVFGLWRWARQALGPVGLLLGWFPTVQSKVRHTAQRQLNDFILKHPEYQS